MAEKGGERRLAAILSADIVGYSRLIGLDEEGTLARINAHRREFLEPTVAEHRGRIVKRTGDGALIEFISAVDAARCAIQVQRGMTQRNAGAPDNQRIELRIGIHLGDVIIEEGDIFGDGVNIAARLEGIAPSGGISICDDVYRQVRDKVDVQFQDIGCHRLSRSVGEKPRCAQRCRMRLDFPNDRECVDAVLATRMSPKRREGLAALFAFSRLADMGQ